MACSTFGYSGGSRAGGWPGTSAAHLGAGAATHPRSRSIGPPRFSSKPGHHCPAGRTLLTLARRPVEWSFVVLRFRSSFLKRTQLSQGGESNLLLLCLPAGGRFALHDRQTGVVVGVLRQVGESNLSGDDRIVPADVGLGASAPVFELHIQPHPELLEVVLQRFEVHSKFHRDDQRLSARECFLGGHCGSSHRYLLR